MKAGCNASGLLSFYIVRDSRGEKKMDKVLLLNGSPHQFGCTHTALREVSDAIEDSGLQTEILHVGAVNIPGCKACGYCSRTGRCIMDGDPVNTVIEKLRDCSGLVVGSPVYYGGPSGAIVSLLERVFYACDSAYLKGKPAAAIASCRRSGTTATFDRLNKFFTISKMPVVSSQYWNGVHGNNPDEVLHDLEGMQTMRTLGRNMAWMIKCFEAGRAVGIEFPESEEPIATNFIR